MKVRSDERGARVETEITSKPPCSARCERIHLVVVVVGEVASRLGRESDDKCR